MCGLVAWFGAGFSLRDYALGWLIGWWTDCSTDRLVYCSFGCLIDRSFGCFVNGWLILCWIECLVDCLID